MPSTDLYFGELRGWYFTRSLRRGRGGADVVDGEGGGGRGVYVMETLRLDFHIGRVECVTCHVPARKDGEGGVKGKEVGWGRWVEVVGWRREIVGAIWESCCALRVDVLCLWEIPFSSELCLIGSDD